MQPETVLKQRIQSIDVLRGLVMLIMALDHTREFFHIQGMTGDPTDLATTTPFLFFTRWITHYCAPTFVFLSGVSVYLAGLKRTPKEMAAFLIKRGLWLILVELVLLSLAFTLNPLFNVLVMQVIWATGVSMIILGLMIRLPMMVITVTGCILFLGHNLLDYVALPEKGAWALLLKMLFTARGTVIQLNATHFIFCLYAVLPWTGVMFTGYTFGQLYKPGFEAKKRQNYLRLAGLIMIVLFVILRFTNLYGDPSPWKLQRTWVFSLISFLNTSKYPCSLLYLFMTIGPALILLAYLENIQNKFTAVLNTYGSVPFFYYVPHFYIIRTLSVILFFASGYTSKDIVTPNMPFLFRPLNFGYNLPVVYLIWLFIIASLYFPCRWFSAYKKTHKQWWLSYL
ncbi:DUF1624 domain-containing protein [Mucilaginibacter celer]|uniref:DUF1624 domain-containing protein n=1 Tax=Mucilaginibacter celer TaxID=2305508 RepID=A0A494VV14_9SPHI|nr:heparan-alpha-glucosaminide N-acetyltransferase domain-containing protein [Mucilaginibacter celer]AYL98834.1 DUF1624 domain-containing protein [Mucilaginibacter celer]